MTLILHDIAEIESSDTPLIDADDAMSQAEQSKYGFHRHFQRNTSALSHCFWLKRLSIDGSA